MNLKNLKTCVELRSENPPESLAIIKASMRSYSPRAAGMMPNNDQMVVLTRQEVPEFIKGVTNDVDIQPRDKWAICKLLSAYLIGDIKDEATA